MSGLLLTTLLACTDGGQGTQDCAESSLITVYTDADNDGYGAPGTEKQLCEVRRGFATNDDDCDDFLASVNPGAIEECDGIDNDCDNIPDEGLREQIYYLDADGDSWGDPDTEKATTACAPPPGFVENRQDCDDANAGINPDATEVCDGAIDNNCNGLVDDADPRRDPKTAPTWYIDQDGDSYGDPDVFLIQCAQPGPGSVLNGDDCDDNDRDVHPGAGEYCNHYDDDCDHLIDDSDPDLDPSEQTEWYADSDLDGAGDPSSTTLACFQPWFYVDNDVDCDDSEPLLTLPAPWQEDRDGDGVGRLPQSPASCTPPATGWVLAVLGVDCDDDNPFISPFGSEICDGLDNDCDGLLDDADDSLDPEFSNEYYLDSDNDTYGDPDEVVLACSPPPTYVEDNTDCVDSDPAINPGALEVCDGADNDCDDDIDDEDADVDLGSAPIWYADFDLDGYGNPNVDVIQCSQPNNYVADPTDCDDGDDTSYPGAPEVCGNGVDEDCDGSDLSCFVPLTGTL